MILLGSSLLNSPVMSLQTGGEIARTGEPIIDPATLSILCYAVTGHLLKNQQTNILRIVDIRELSDLGMIVDSIEEIVPLSDVIKLQELADLNFSLVGMKVTDQRKKSLGKVVDYTIDTGSFIVQQLTVRRPLLKSFNDTELVIHRSQIIEISRTSIVVHSEAKIPEPELHEVVGSYVNPFRKPRKHAPEATHRDTP